jgi:hypothetical protein
MFWKRVLFSWDAVRERVESWQFVLAVVLLDGLAAGVAYTLAADLDGFWRGAVVVGAVVVGTLTALTVLALWAWFTAPRRDLKNRVEILEDEVDRLRRNLSGVIDERFGDVDQFIPTYHKLRTDLQVALRRARRAQETGRLWRWGERLEDSTWKKNHAELSSHPYAVADRVAGPLAEAFGHVERLNTASSMRLRTRTVRATDELEIAIPAFEAAEAALTAAIDQAERESQGQP